MNTISEIQMSGSYQSIDTEDNEMTIGLEKPP